MTDPISLGIGLGTLVGGAMGSGLFSKGGQQATPQQALTPTAPVDQSQPAIPAGTKPAQKNSQQQSFVSGAAALQQAGRANVGGNTGSSGGKSLLGQ